MDNAKIFLAKVLPWPAPNEDGWINVHWVEKDKKMWVGRACKNVEEAANNIQWAIDKGPKNMYACMSRQKNMELKTSKSGHEYRKAIRLNANATHFKSIWFDLDFKQYPSPEDTIKAFNQFLADTKLPPASVIVNSGGGLQLYWTFMDILPIAVWTPLAGALAEAAKQHNLLADTQCTIDASRILRVPDTWNYKYNPPRSVRILKCNDFDYTIDRIANPLLPYKVAEPLQAKAPIDNALGAGIERPQAKPVDIRGLISECAFIADTLRTRGEFHRQPLWHCVGLLSTFLEDGRTLLHIMSKGHSGYFKDDTDKLFDRKEKDKREKNIGWPSCKSIYDAGSSFCKNCPHFSAGKSPLNFAKPVGVQTQVNGVKVTLKSNIILPPNYLQGQAGEIWETYIDDDGGQKTRPITYWPVIEGWIEENDDSHIHFKSEPEKTISIPTKDIVPPSYKELGRHLMARVLTVTGSKQLQLIGGFFMAWLKELKQHTASSAHLKPLGWNEKDGNVIGFAYGGYLWNGINPAAHTPPLPAEQEIYTPAGDLNTWKDAARLITDQNKPELNAIIASAFGGPLVQFSGHDAFMLSAYSTESGTFKTTAMQIAGAVWYSPKNLQSLSGTSNARNNKLGRLNSLPVYWDEMHMDSRQAVNEILQLTQGREKERLDANSNPRETQTWRTILVTASNSCLVDTALKSNMSPAAIYRIVEYPVPYPTPGGAGILNGSLAENIVSKLKYNYGQAGLIYAQWLGANMAQIEQDMYACKQEAEAKIEFMNEERFWRAAYACLVLGARYANKLGFTQIDEEALKNFLIQNILTMRRGVQEIKIFSSNSVVADLVGRFMTVVGVKRCVVTDYTSKQHLRKVNVTWPSADIPYIQVAQKENIIRVGLGEFTDWIRKNPDPMFKENAESILKDIQKNPGVTKTLGRIGGGASLSTSQVVVLDFDMTKIPELATIDPLSNVQAAVASSPNVVLFNP